MRGETGHDRAAGLRPFAAASWNLRRTDRMLSFPNLSRSYDERLRRIRFWAHDAALEIPFFLDTVALQQMSPATPTASDEAGLLGAFDLNREAIHRVAARVYVRHQRGSYTLSASDFA
jgi:Protein of unknown function (DUF1488)